MLSNNLQFAEGPWFAAQVRYQREQAVAALLATKEIPVYVPTYKEHRRWADRIKELDRALFPGYVFFHIQPSQWLKVQSLAGVLRIVGVGNRPSAIEQKELESIERMVLAGVPRRPCPFPEVGDIVEVRSGPLSGSTGVLQEVRNARTLILSIGLLRRSVAVDLQADWITVSKQLAPPPSIGETITRMIPGQGR